MPKGDNFKAGKPPNSGRKPGTPNKENKALREMILGALDKVGGEDYLARQAIENPGPFIGLIGKVLPTTIATDANAPPVIEIRRVLVVPNHVQKDQDLE
jgi:hypothetical protein